MAFEVHAADRPHAVMCRPPYLRLALLVCVSLVAACKEDIHTVEIRGFVLTEDDGVPAVAWIRAEERCYGSDFSNVCEPDTARKYFHEGWGIHSQLGESEPISHLPSAGELPSGSWSDWHPHMSFDVSAGHHWQFVWSPADEPAGAPSSAFLLHDGELTTLAIAPTDWAEILARPDDTAVIVMRDAEPSLRVLQIGSTGEILAEDRIEQLDVHEWFAEANVLLAKLAGDDLLLAIGTISDGENVLIYRQSDDDVDETSVTDFVRALWGDASLTRLMHTSGYPSRDVTVVDVVDGSTRTFQPSPDSDCDSFVMGDFLPSGEAMAIFEHRCENSSDKSWIVVSEDGDQFSWDWDWDLGVYPIHRTVGIDQGLLVFAQEQEVFYDAKGERHEALRGISYLLDPQAQMLVPLAEVDLMPGGRLSEQ